MDWDAFQDGFEEGYVAGLFSAAIFGIGYLIFDALVLGG